MKRFLGLSLLVLFPLLGTAAEPAPLKLLFLGDNGPHRPQERFVQLEPALRDRGIALQYTDDVSVALTADTLKQFDGLVLYANIDSITPAQETALLDYVANGKGFVPLHCASFCFRNSPKFIALVGAQFQKHGGEIFHVEAADLKHPILQGYGGFSSWDETYVHTKHNPENRTVLEYRVQGMQADGQTREPWTWVRTHGDGRVFYTAWGHDKRTFGHPGFHNLVERGIRWACGQDPRLAGPYSDPTLFSPLPMTPIPADAPKFEYVDVGPKIPNYTAGARWGTLDAAKTLMQKPLTPDQSRQRYSVPEGFRLELFASEPDLQGKPIAMTWDERGRLWVCETLDYPNELQPGGKGRDRIRICADTNGDGRADKFTVFAEGLSIPTSIAFYRGGAIVQNGIETLYLKDTDDDDVADVRQVLISGWELGDTHGGVSNFQYGLDNHYWGMQGYNNSAPVLTNGERVPNFRMGFFRFQMDQSVPAETASARQPAVSALEFVRSTNNNTWGLGISEEGLIFGSTANRNPSVFMPIANRYYERVRGWSAEQLGGIADTHLFKPITDKVRQVDNHGGYTAGAGHALYTARNYPQPFWNRTAFVCGPTGHLVGLFHLIPDGADFRSTSPMNLAASDDEWAAPIMAEVGPDGNVWILDWYNYIIQHNPTPAGFQTGKGNAYESDLRDKRHGRVYRVVYGGESATPKAQSEPEALASDRPQELVAALQRDNLLWRRHAQRLLVERGNPDVVPALVSLVREPSVDAIGLNVGAIHALWTLHGLGVIDEQHPEVIAAVAEALQHPSAGVRRNALQVLPMTKSATQLALPLLSDADDQVRLAALLALADLPPTLASAQRLAAESYYQFSGNRRWLQDALVSAAANHGLDFVSAAVNGSEVFSMGVTPEAACWSVVPRVSEHLSRGKLSGDDVGVLLTAINGTQRMGGISRLAPAVLEGLARGWPRGHSVQITEATELQLVTLFEKSNGSVRSQLAKLAPSFGSTALERFSAEIAETLLATMSNSQQRLESRVAAAQELVAFQPQSNDVVQRLLTVITPQMPSDVADGLIAALNASTAPELGSRLIERTKSLTPAARQAALRVLLGRPQTIVAALDAFESGSLQLSELSLDQKQALAAYPDRAIRQRATELLARQGGLPNADRQKVIDELHAVTERTGDPLLGKEIFKKQCAKCHMHSGEGQKIGPDLTGMAVHPKHELLIHILDPSRSVEGNYRVYTVELADGRVLSGMLAGESRTAIEIVDTEAKRHAIPREDIEELVGSNKSVMPEGFEKQMTPDELTNLLEFLTQRGRYVPLDLRKVASSISTRGMFHTADAQGERLIFDDWSPKTFQDVPFALVDPQGDRVPNVVMLHSDNGTFPRTMPRSVELPCNMPVKALHFLSGVSGWGFPLGEPESVSMIVRLKYADGTAEDHPLRNGVHFADYIRVVDVPGSKLAFRLRGRQIRYFTVEPQRSDVVSTVELIKGPDRTAPIVMAITAESRMP